MATYINIYDMQAHPDFRKQVITACRIAAGQIRDEDPEAANHAARLAWAQEVLGYDGITSSDLVQGMIVACTSNGALQVTAPNGPWSDSDIQFVVNSLIDIQAA